MIANGEPFVQIIHGFAEMTMESDTHPCDGLLGGFIGDRMVISVDGAQVVQEPPFVTQFVPTVPALSVTLTYALTDTPASPVRPPPVLSTSRLYLSPLV
jgi:hypothetical protein